MSDIVFYLWVCILLGHLLEERLVFAIRAPEVGALGVARGRRIDAQPRKAWVKADIATAVKVIEGTPLDCAREDLGVKHKVRRAACQYFEERDG